jgi:hypothetical protein
LMPMGSARPATLDEILAPIREGFTESCLSDELTALFEEAREDVWGEKQQKRSE